MSLNTASLWAIPAVWVKLPTAPSSTLEGAYAVSNGLGVGLNAAFGRVGFRLAAAEDAGLVVLHYDADFDRIAAVTGQECEWVVAPGTVD